MAQEPPSGKPEDEHRPKTSEVTQIFDQLEAAKKEATATAANRQAEALEIREGEGPTRPEGHPRGNSPGWTDGPGRVEQERSAEVWNRWVNEPYADHNASIENKQATKPTSDNSLVSGVKAEPQPEQKASAQQENAQDVRAIAEAAYAREQGGKERQQEQER